MNKTANNRGAITEELLKQIARDELFDQFKIAESSSNCINNGFAGIVTCFKLIGKDCKGEPKLLSVIVKSVPNGFRIGMLYEREIFMYEKVFPLFAKLEKSNGIEESKLFPNYYRGYEKEVLILENLCESGYRLHAKRLPMDHDHVCLVLKEYGRFHALSMVLRRQEVEIFDFSKLDDVYVKFLKSTSLNKAMKSKCNQCCETLDQCDETQVGVYKKFIDSIDNVIDSLPNSVDEYSVLLHGDCWSTNIMFQYEDESTTSKPTKVAFIDFQLSRLGSPVLDLSNFLYGCSSKDVINNLNYYMDVYYKSLSSHLERLGYNCNLLYPKAIYQDHWKRFSKIGLMRSMLIIHSCLADTQPHSRYAETMISEGNLSKVYNYNISSKDEYNDRVRHNILHFIQNSFI